MIRGSMDFGSIERKSLAAAIAERLRTYILSGHYAPGERLPSERELAQILKVTRTTLREAVKILETLKLVTVKQGDGVRVMDFTRGANLDILADLVFRAGSPDPVLVQHILEARQIFGSVIARLAAERRSPEQMEQYRNAVVALDKTSADPQSLLEADLLCFDALATASGNTVFRFVLNWMRSICERHGQVFLHLFNDKSRLVKSHKAILKAMEDKDGTKAEAAAFEMLAYQVPKDWSGGRGNI